MRQAGRHLPEYRQVRADAGGFLSLVANSDQACEVTLQPVHRYDLDGAILFSDILVIPMALGQDLWFETGEGPKLGTLPSSLTFNDAPLTSIYQTLKKVCNELAGTSVTTLGFVGAPWTVATYMIEQGKPRFDVSRAFLESGKAPSLFRSIIDATIAYARAQVAAGAEVIKIFDSWAKELPDQAAFQRWSLEPMIEIAEALTPTPVIFFPRGCGTSVSLFEAAYSRPFGFAVGDGDDLAGLRDRAGANVCLQGNLSPQALLGPEDQQDAAVAEILSVMEGSPHIFNLGHGVDKETDPARVMRLVEQVRAGV